MKQNINAYIGMVAVALLIIPSILSSQTKSPPSPGGFPTKTGMREGALVSDVYGTSHKRLPNSSEWKTINSGDYIPPMTTIKTGTNSATLLTFPGRHIMRIGEKTTVEMKELGKNKVFNFNVVSGNVWAVVSKIYKPTKYEVETPSAVAGVSGTVFQLSYDDNEDETNVSTEEGQVNVRNHSETAGRPVTSGNHIRMRRGLAGKPMAQTIAMRNMWKTLRAEEGWTNHNYLGERPKLCNTVDMLARNVYREGMDGRRFASDPVMPAVNPPLNRLTIPNRRVSPVKVTTKRLPSRNWKATAKPPLNTRPKQK